MSHYKLSDICKEISIRVNNPSTSEYNKFVGLEHYVSGDVLIKNYGSTKNIVSAMKAFEIGDVLVARRNVYLKRASQVNFNGITSGDSIVLRPTNSKLSKLLPFILNTDQFWDYADQYSDGTMSKRLSPKTLMNYEFDLPEEDKLSNLSDILWAANEAREKYRILLQKTDELVKSRFVEMFGDDKISKNVTMSEITSIITDGTHQPPRFQSSGIPFIFVSNITTNELTYEAEKFINQETYNELYKRTPIEIGDLLLSTVGSYGHPAIVKKNDKFLFQRHIAYLKPIREKINSVYLHAAILTDNVQRQIDKAVKGIAQKTLNLSEIKKLTIPLPPLSLQTQFAAFVQQVDKSKFVIKQSIEKLELLKKKLMQDYFG